MNPATRRYLTAVVCCMAFAACNKKPPAKVYGFHGTVVSLDPNTNQASIHNDNVPGWMGEMTMQYPVENKDEYKALRPGERISAKVNVTDDGYWLSSVREEKAP